MNPPTRPACEALDQPRSISHLGAVLAGREWDRPEHRARKPVT